MELNLMTTDRRDDIGGKILTGVMGGIIMLLITTVVNAAWSTASQGLSKANEVSDRVTALEARFGAFQSDLTEIKELLKRKLP